MSAEDLGECLHDFFEFAALIEEASLSTRTPFHFFGLGLDLLEDDLDCFLLGRIAVLSEPPTHVQVLLIRSVPGDIGVVRGVSRFAAETDGEHDQIARDAAEELGATFASLHAEAQRVIEAPKVILRGDDGGVDVLALE